MGALHDNGLHHLRLTDVAIASARKHHRQARSETTHLVLSPVLVGGGKPYFPQLDHLVPLRLKETHTFQSGALYLRYQQA
ncbi:MULTISPECIES: hypothetical protein [Myxococcus]|uniref:hypothetical protein n=1 Tax=Myxococcus TaxID=32 RepID=UPI001142B294|nr:MULTISPECIES: hypothetical protein [Myxococcus]NOK00038.1 hypothetical protein [Myxococcus xanthus]